MLKNNSCLISGVVILNIHYEMRDFFVQCFKDLHSLTGLRQYLEIASHPEGKEKAQAILDKIINGMIHQSANFEKMIPYEHQKEVIEHGIISDPELYALNAKMVYKWLHAEYKVMQTRTAESGHEETNKLLETLEEPKPISEETQKLIREFEYSLSQGFASPQKQI